MGKGKGKEILGSIISFASGLVGVKNPAIGLAIGLIKKKPVGQQVKEFMDKNKQSVASGEGNTDFAGVFGSVMGGLIVIGFTSYLALATYLLVTEKITFEQFLQMICF